MFTKARQPGRVCQDLGMYSHLLELRYHYLVVREPSTRFLSSETSFATAVKKARKAGCAGLTSVAKHV